MTRTSELGRLLHRDHLQTIAVLDALETRTGGRAAARPMTAADAEDRALAEAAITVVEREVIRHFAFEETSLFPLFVDRGAADMVAMLTSEHKRIGAMGDRLSALAVALLAAGVWPAEVWREFRIVAGEFVQASMFHLQKEEIGVVQRLPLLVDAETDAALARRLAQMDLAET
jgi:hypothetical protein